MEVEKMSRIRNGELNKPVSNTPNSLMTRTALSCYVPRGASFKQGLSLKEAAFAEMETAPELMGRSVPIRTNSTSRPPRTGTSCSSTAVRPEN